MTYLEATSLLYDAPFSGRVRVSLSKYMNYILATAPGPEHDAQIKEGLRIANAFEAEVQKCLYSLVGDPEVLAAASGSNVDDNTLSLLVEKIVKSLAPVTPAAPAVMSSGPLPQHYAYERSQPIPKPPVEDEKKESR